MIVIRMKRNDESLYEQTFNSCTLFLVRWLMIWRDSYPSPLPLSLSLLRSHFSPIDIPRLFLLLIPLLLFLYFSFFLLWCTTTIGGWQQTTTIAITVRAIRCRHRRRFRRLIIIALSRSGLSLLRSSTLLLLLLSSCRFHRSRCSSRITTTALTSPTDIHNSCLSRCVFLLKNPFTKILLPNERGIFIQLPMNVNWTMSFLLLFLRSHPTTSVNL